MNSNVRLNDRIRAAEVRLITESGEQLGIKPTDEALKIAMDDGLDLVEVAPLATPPVCRIMDYSKYRYEQEQKAKRARKHQANLVIKEMKMRPKIDVHDYETKKKHVVRFLEAGHKVKMTIMFRGREMTHTELGRKLLERLAGDVTHLATVESSPKQDGRNMLMMLAPHKEFVEAAIELKHQDDEKYRLKHEGYTGAAEDDEAAEEGAKAAEAEAAEAPEVAEAVVAEEAEAAEVGGDAGAADTIPEETS